MWDKWKKEKKNSLGGEAISRLNKNSSNTAGDYQRGTKKKRSGRGERDVP